MIKKNKKKNYFYVILMQVEKMRHEYYILKHKILQFADDCPLSDIDPLQ